MMGHPEERSDSHGHPEERSDSHGHPEERSDEGSAVPILIASDHAGFALKKRLEAWLREAGYAVEDLGTDSDRSTDYADYAHPLAQRISDGDAQRGILLCGTGLGMSYVANRYPHVRAAVAWSPEIAELARRHNDANVLALPARFLSEDSARQILQTWLETPFDGGRHARRVEKIERDDVRMVPVPNEDAAQPTETR